MSATRVSRKEAEEIAKLVVKEKTDALNARHAYFTAEIETIFVPALLVRTETPVKGESVAIGGLFYGVKTSSGATVSHYVPVKKTRNKRKADELK